MIDDKKSNAPLAKLAIVMILVANLLVFLSFLYALYCIGIYGGVLTASDDEAVYGIFLFGAFIVFISLIFGIIALLQTEYNKMLAVIAILLVVTFYPTLYLFIDVIESHYYHFHYDKPLPVYVELFFNKN